MGEYVLQVTECFEFIQEQDLHQDFGGIYHRNAFKGRYLKYDMTFYPLNILQALQT